jgi:ribosomal protein S12 methylthiotransferase
LPQRYEKKLSSLLPEVDIFVGAGEFSRIAELIQTEGPEKMAVTRPSYLYDHRTPRILVTPPHAAYIKIAEGCFHPCSFCIIPQIRGVYRSRTVDSIVEEAEKMLGRGVKELNLIAQDTTAYGRDLKDGSQLERLLSRLVHLEGDKWIRLLYAYPHHFPETLIHVMREYSEICPYLDIPIQHISQRILASMRREGDASEIMNLITRLRVEIPGIFLRTSVIVGYPGETDEEFDELLDFISWAKFDHLGAFHYSAEEGTKAATLENPVPPIVVKRRYREIMSLQQEISLFKNSQHVGKIMQVLVEKKVKGGKHAFRSRHAGQAPDIDGLVFIDHGKTKEGEFALVRIKDSQVYDLIADIVSPEVVLRDQKGLL